MFKVLHMEIWYTQVNINYCFLDCLTKAFIILTGITNRSLKTFQELLSNLTKWNSKYIKISRVFLKDFISKMLWLREN